MSQVQVEQKSYEMPPREGFTVAHFLTVADIDLLLRFYETIFESRILSRGDGSGAPGYFQIANTWLIVNVGGGPTPDKPSVTLSVPPDPDAVSSFMNIRVADIRVCGFPGSYFCVKAFSETDLTEDLKRFDVPTLILHGDDDQIVPIADSALLSSEIVKNAKLVVY